MLLRGWAAFSRQAKAGPIATRALTNASRERWTSNCLCCELGSMKIATRSAAAAPIEAPPRFLSLTVWMRTANVTKRCSGSPSQGFRLASPSVRPTSSRGRHWTGGPGARTRHNRNLITVSKTYVRLQALDGKGSLVWGHTTSNSLKFL